MISVVLLHRLAMLYCRLEILPLLLAILVEGTEHVRRRYLDRSQKFEVRSHHLLQLSRIVVCNRSFEPCINLTEVPAAGLSLERSCRLARSHRERHERKQGGSHHPRTLTRS